MLRFYLRHEILGFIESGRKYVPLPLLDRTKHHTTLAILLGLNPASKTIPDGHSTEPIASQCFFLIHVPHVHPQDAIRSFQAFNNLSFSKFCLAQLARAGSTK